MEFTIFDVEYPSEWASVNRDGVWCDFCGELLVSPFLVDEDTSCPESCRACGAPDVEDMAEYFT